MEGGLLAYLAQGLCQIRASDVAMAILGLFLFSSLVEKLTNKGPMLWPFMGIIPSLILNFKDIYEWSGKVLNRCGGTFPYRGMWVDRAYGVVTVNPSNIEYMLKIRFKNFPKGNYYRERFSDLLGDGIFNADDEVWKEQRKAATSEIHSNRFVVYSSKIIQELVHEKLLTLIEKLAVSQDSVDLQDVLLRFMFDNICMAAFGVDPGCLSIDLPDVQFAKAFEQATECTLLRFLIPEFVWKFMKLLSVGTERRLIEAVKTVHEFAEKTVDDRRVECRKFNDLSNRSDLLSGLMQSDSGYSDKFLKDFCISLILAGRDTSSVALTWFFWLLNEHSHVENQILAEIIQILRQRKINNGWEQEKEFDIKNIVFTDDELKKMEYLHAALSESLRLYPSVPFDFKQVVEDDVLPDGTAVKKGAGIIYSIFSMARSETIWGKDCREFKPERWLKDGKFVSEKQFKYVVFNAGPRLCAGRSLAYMQMKMVAASVLSRYSVLVVKGHPVAPKLTTTLYMKHGLMVNFKPRVSLLSIK